MKRDEKRGRRLLSVAMEHGHADAAKLLAQVDTALEIAEAATPNTKAEYLAKLDEAWASDDDPDPSGDSPEGFREVSGAIFLKFTD